MFLLTCLHLSSLCTPYSFSSFNYIKFFDSFILLCLYISYIIYLFNTYLLSTYYVAPTRGVSQVLLAVKNQSTSAGDVRDSGSIPESGRSPGEGHGNLLHYSHLENPMDRGVWRAAVHSIAKSQTWMKQLGMAKWPPPTSLVVLWLRLHASNAGGLGSIPGQGTRSHIPQLKDPACLN